MNEFLFGAWWFVSGLLIVAGTIFVLLGSVGVVRFPDLYSRLHAITKADNLGIGLLAIGLAMHAGSFLLAAKFLLIWLLVLPASSAVGHLIAQHALKEEKANRSSDSGAA